MLRINFLIFIFLLFFSCQKKVSPQKPPVIPVRAARVQVKDAPIFIETIGHVSPIQSVAIKSRVEGLLTNVYFKEGDEVKKGDLLLAIDPREFQATLKKNKAVLEENLASLRLAEDKVLRYASLLKDEYYSELDYGNLQTNALALDAIVKQNQADIEYAETQLSYCWIYAPMDGKTGVLQIHEGNMIKPNDDTPITTINQISPIYINYYVPEKELPRIQKYRKEKEPTILATFNEFKEGAIEGSLHLINNRVDTKTGMIELRAIYTNSNRILWPGQFVRIRHVLTVQKKALIIPHQAVMIATDGAFVYVINEDHTVAIRKIKLGQREDDDVVALEGLQPNELVVTEGQINLAPGFHVIVKDQMDEK